MGSEPKNLKIEIIDPRVVDGKAIFPVTIGDPIFVKWPSPRLRIHQDLRTEKWEALQVLKLDVVFEDIEAFTSCTVEVP